MNEERMKIACVVMASGEGKRFGPVKGGKLLAPADGVPVLQRVLEALPTEEFSSIVVVTRWDGVESLCAKMGISCVRHDSPRRSDTVRAGFAASGDPDGCLFVAGDQPFLQRESLVRLLEAFREANTGGKTAVCRLGWEGEAGNPVLFPREMFSALQRLEGNRGGGSLLPGSGIPVTVVQASCPQELRDIDTPEDLLKY